MTAAEELALSEAALTTLLQGGQSISVLGRNFTRADYRALTERIDELRSQVRREARGGIRLQRAVSNG